IKDVGALIAVEITDVVIDDLPVLPIDLLRARDAAPPNQPVAPALCQNVRAAVAVEIAQQQLIEFGAGFIKVAPFSLSARGVIPGCASRQEGVFFAISIEIAYAEAVGRIGTLELVIADDQF